MKKLFYFATCLAAIALQACTQDVTIDYTPSVTPLQKVQIDGSIDQQDNTRVDDSGFCAGDNVGLYLVNYENEAPGELMVEDNQADNVKFTLQEDGSWASEYDIYYKDDDTNVDFYGYYPYADPSSVEEYPFEVAKDQRTPAEHGKMGAYEASDFLWATCKNVTPTAAKVNLRFQHKMSSARVRFTMGDGWADVEEFESVKKEVLVTNTIRKSTIDLATGEVMPTGEKPLDGIIPVEDNCEFRAIVVPQTVAAGEAVLVITIDGHPRKYVRDVATEYEPGKITNFDLKIRKVANTGEIEVVLEGVTISEWEADNASHQDDAREYVVVHCPVAGQLERTMVDRLEMDVAAIKNLKLTGYINATDYSFMNSKMTSLMRLNLKEVESLIDGVYRIPRMAFYNKTTLIKCVLPDKLERIEDSAFSGSSLGGTIILPEGLKFVDGFGHTKITKVQFPSTLEVIGANAFSSCSSLMCELSFPNSLKKIQEEAFYRSAIQGKLILPENLEYIGESAFYRCTGLTGSLKIPNGVKTIPSLIGYGTFCGCGFNGTLTLSEGLIEIGDAAFSENEFKGELNLPESLVAIGSKAFYDNEFSGTLVFPKEITSIGTEAFAGCWRLSGVVEIPQNIMSVPSQVFAGCKNIEGVILHKNIETIESAAFSGCYYINSIVCKAKTPPVIASSTFGSVAKDNFVVEVPEASVKQYQNAAYWQEFKRIEAHREFSISRNLLRTLNTEHSRTFLVRALAGEEWSVESCPEWVTVTPSSGVGKTEVTVTVHEMAAGDVATFQIGTLNSSGKVTYTTHNGRGGEVVFLLNGKDYRVRMTIEQYDYEYGDGDMITHQTATVGNGVNIVLLGDCFDAKDIAEGKYLKAMQDAYTYFFDIEPYITYKDYFNVYSVFGMSADSGMGTANTIREARFGSQYTLNEGVSPDFETVFAGACVAPINDDVSTTLIILVENSNEYGGLCCMWGDGSAVAICPMSSDPAPYDFRGIVHHEAGGHGFGKLADEYILYSTFIPEGTRDFILSRKLYGFFDNISVTNDWNKVTWSHLIFDPQYSNVVDIYEGSNEYARGVWRSEATSCMNNNIPYYNAISREAMVKRIMKYAGEEYSFEEFKAKDYESLPSVTTYSAPWSGDNATASSRFGQQPPKFMGEKPEFDKSKF